MGNITISVNELGQFVLFLLACTVAVIAIIALLNLNKAIKRVSLFMDENSENLYKSLEVLPKLAENIEDTSLSIKENVEKLGGVVDSIGSAVSETAAVVGDKSENLLQIVETAAVVAKTVVGAFTSRK